LARHEALLFPGFRERLDLGVDEAPDLSAQQLVLLAEIRGGERFGLTCGGGGTVHGSAQSVTGERRAAAERRELGERDIAVHRRHAAGGADRKGVVEGRRG